MKKSIFFKGLLALLFSVNLSAMYNPGSLFHGDPDPQDHSWDLFNPILQNWNLNVVIRNGGFLSLSVMNGDFREVQQEELRRAEITGEYGLPGGDIKKDFYSDPSLIKRISCPIIGSAEFKEDDVVVQINDDGELWHLGCLVEILRKDPSYENIESLTIFFLAR